MVGPGAVRLFYILLSSLKAESYLILTFASWYVGLTSGSLIIDGRLRNRWLAQTGTGTQPKERLELIIKYWKYSFTQHLSQKELNAAQRISVSLREIVSSSSYLPVHRAVLSSGIRGRQLDN